MPGRPTARRASIPQREQDDARSEGRAREATSVNTDRAETSLNTDNTSSLDSDRADGSVIVVVATDAPLDARNLRRLAARAMLGLSRTGSPSTNGSGDYIIAFSTAASVRIHAGETSPRRVESLPNDSTSPLFLACVEATEEAVYNSLLRATTITGRGGTRVEALPIERTVEILKKYNALRQTR